ncbi:terpene cyclase/mutase family protein, partial [bacterium]|nr:terpene cyclase/mutase family protein [bacterium]
MFRHPWLGTLMASLCLATSLPRPALARPAVGPADVAQAIDRGCRALIGSGSAIERHARGVGANALVVVALLHGGTPASDPHIRQAMEAISASFLGDTYRTSLATMAMAAVDAARYRGELKEAAAWLAQAQNRDGGWRYRVAHDRKQTSDHSCTQFALLGLHAAVEAGVAVDAAIWRRAAAYLARTQCPDGGWIYQGRGTKSFGSMTAASIGSLYLCERHTDPGPLPCGAYRPDPRIARGLAWISRHFAVDRNPGRGGTPYYYLYALERIGILSARPTLGGHDWYREGASYVVRRQRADGTWGELSDTCFALLFLAKGRAPLLVQKVEREGRWNEDPNDVRRFIDRAAAKLGTPV